MSEKELSPRHATSPALVIKLAEKFRLFIVYTFSILVDILEGANTFTTKAAALLNPVHNIEHLSCKTQEVSTLKSAKY
jgi:hypothetical protein